MIYWISIHLTKPSQKKKWNPTKTLLSSGETPVSLSLSRPFPYYISLYLSLPITSLPLSLSPYLIYYLSLSPPLYILSLSKSLRTIHLNVNTNELSPTNHQQELINYGLTFIQLRWLSSYIKVMFVSCSEKVNRRSK